MHIYENNTFIVDTKTPSRYIFTAPRIGSKTAKLDAP